MMEPKFHSTSGRKYVNKNGISAIKDGVKRSKHIELVDITKGRKPPWLNAKIPKIERIWVLPVKELIHPISAIDINPNVSDIYFG